MEESWSSYTVKPNWFYHNPLDFNEWLKEKAEMHERMKTFPGKSKTRNLSRKKLQPEI